MMKIFKSLGKGISGFFKDECFYLAAILSYFLIVSLVPFSLLVITLFGYILGESNELYQFTLSRLMNAFPSVTEGITIELRNIITYRGISMATLIIYSLLSVSLFYSIEHAMNIIFKVPKKRHFLLSLFWIIFVATVLIAFLFISFTLSSIAGILRRYHMVILGIEVGYKAGIFIKYIAPFLLVLGVFTTIYTVMPRVKVRLKDAFMGALFVTILWEFAKHIFTWYVKNVIHFGTIYGSLSTFILFLLWMYYLSCIFLLGGEFVNNLRTGDNARAYKKRG
ncbi:MAG: YihY/virulence factor BrkB family protein [Thermodesulfovibrionia bacterium]